MTESSFCQCILHRIAAPNPTQIIKSANTYKINIHLYFKYGFVSDLGYCPCYWSLLAPLLLVPTWAVLILVGVSAHGLRDTAGQAVAWVVHLGLEGVELFEFVTGLWEKYKQNISKISLYIYYVNIYIYIYMYVCVYIYICTPS